MNTYDGAILGNMLDDIAKIICCICYLEYSSTIYGTPDMSESGEIFLPLFTKDWKIIELLVRLKLFQKMLQQNNFPIIS